MPVKIPWEVIGPVAAGVVAILIIVFAFILKFQKQSRVTAPALSTPTEIPKNTDTVSKQSLCFNHESRISKNETGIENVEEQLEKTQKLNRQDHKEIFGKIDTMTAKIITEIVKNNSQ